MFCVLILITYLALDARNKPLETIQSFIMNECVRLYSLYCIQGGASQDSVQLVHIGIQFNYALWVIYL